MIADQASETRSNSRARRNEVSRLSIATFAAASSSCGIRSESSNSAFPRYGCSDSTGSGSRVPGHPATASSHGATTTCSTEGASRRASSTVASIGSSRPRRSDVSQVMTTFASASASRWATAAAAKPEKTGTCSAPTCAQACEAIAASNDMSSGGIKTYQTVCPCPKQVGSPGALVASVLSSWS